MKVIVAGSRAITEDAAVARGLEVLRAESLEIGEVVSGVARGVDRLGERWAAEHGLPCHVMPAEWQAHGKRAGLLRNEQMAQEADALVALHCCTSGPLHRLRVARAHALRSFEYVVEPDGTWRCARLT